MRAGYPVRVVQITVFTRPIDEHTWDVGDTYWTVFARLIGECGHKHKTESAAVKCRPAMVAKWRKARGWK